ncbi:biotin carboxyl carrier domain-containing protein [Epibacterium sp. DP7N7-1]|nr:biotin carboxyl carrier domain-containing protein [Epibacterium sp. DP7N7-1]NKX75214.1 biotin carboxyl carrier domain-containing protein [Rhodobacteraceae bacterium R_SAG3]
MSNIQSPLPGTFYHQASPEEPPFKSAGDAVAVGDVIGLIEVMKTFIQVTAEEPGTFEKYAVQNAAPVTAGDVVAELR